ncbi:MAG TPA: HD domain-containing protein [Mycobacteriales bacterium]|nr:HD domain-containing protein [Mycobacteriales bacterium]
MARELLAGLPARLRHVEAVAQRARAVAARVAAEEAEVAVAAAWLHDIGYASELALTGFHHLDGARYLRSLGENRLAGLVAYHGAASEEAQLRGLAEELGEFEDEASPVAHVVTYADVTTAGDGSEVTLVDRIADVRRRYGDEHVVTDALLSAESRLGEMIGAVRSASTSDAVTR